MDRVHQSLTAVEEEELINSSKNRHAIELGPKIDSSLLKTNISSQDSLKNRCC